RDDHGITSERSDLGEGVVVAALRVVRMNADGGSHVVRTDSRQRNRGPRSVERAPYADTNEAADTGRVGALYHGLRFWKVCADEWLPERERGEAARREEQRCITSGNARGASGLVVTGRADLLRNQGCGGHAEAVRRQEADRFDADEHLVGGHRAVAQRADHRN